MKKNHIPLAGQFGDAFKNILRITGKVGWNQNFFGT
jgi:hypothetical protein